MKLPLFVVRRGTSEFTIRKVGDNDQAVAVGRRREVWSDAASSGSRALPKDEPAALEPRPEGRNG